MFAQSKASDHSVTGRHGATAHQTGNPDFSTQSVSQAFAGLPGQDGFVGALAAQSALGGSLFGQYGVQMSYAPLPATMALPAPGLALPDLPVVTPDVLVSTPGSGLVFNNTYDASCTAQYEACIVAAEQELESLFTNADTINVSFSESNQGNTGVALGNSSSGYLYSYASLRAAILSRAPGDVLPASDPSGGASWYVPAAYGRMLGLTSATLTPDLSVSLNTYYGWSYGQDVINGLIHELSEGGLGRIGALGGAGGGNWSAMDLFRYNAAGHADYSNGRDGQTTYFSSNGGVSLSNANLPGKGAPTLSYNNQYNSSGTKVNGGDTADWVQNNVFGSTGGGETLSLTQTELEVLQALGWHLSLKQDVDQAAGTWETPTHWSTGSMPIEAQDAYINGVTVSLDSNVIVNSIATSASGILSIGDSAATRLTAVDGTVLNTADTSFVGSGNLGDIAVYTGSTLQIGFVNETFFNAGTVGLGKGAGGSGAGNLDIAGSINLNGAGTITLGETGTTGEILDAPSTSGDSLLNVNNTISGSGLIELGGTFDNQAAGKVESQASLRISAGTFTNEGVITDEANATLDLGLDGTTQSLANSGSVIIDANADLAVSGNYTVTGTGGIAFKGAGAEITSDGSAAQLTNAGIISADTSGRIGDANLTLSNSGTIGASLTGVTLAIDTGSNTVTNSGTISAANNATISIASNLANHGDLLAGSSTSGSTSSGTIMLGRDGGTTAVANSGIIAVYGGSDLEIGGTTTASGTGYIGLKGAGATITSDGTAPATFTNAGNIYALASGQIGDAGIKATNDLTFINTGTVIASGSGVTLTINTGGNLVQNTGVLEAASNTTLFIDSPISGSGTLLAETGAAIDLSGGGSFGGTLSGAGTVAIDGATTLAAGVRLLAAEVTESANVTLASVGVTNALGDVFAITAAASSTVTLGSTGTGNFTNAGTLLANGAGTARITTSLVDSGAIEVTSGTLLVTGALTGAGALSIGAGASAYLTAGGALTETIVGAGTLQLGGAYSLAGGDVAAGTVQVHSTHQLSGNGTLAGAVIDNGTVASAGGTLLVGGAVSAAGTLSAGFGTVLDLAGGGSFGGAISGAGTVAIGGATTLTAGAHLSAATIADTANLTLASVAVTNNTGDTFTFAAASGSTVTLGSTGTGAFTNAGSLVASGDGTATIGAPFTNGGTVSALSGTLAFLGTVTGSGTMDIGTAGTLSLALGAASGQVADFLGSTGGLDLAHPLDFAGTITGFGGSDQVFLENTSFTTFGYSGNILTVKDGTTTEASLHFAGSSNSFSLTSETHGILITFA